MYHRIEQKEMKKMSINFKQWAICKRWSFTRVQNQVTPTKANIETVTVFTTQINVKSSDTQAVADYDMDHNLKRNVRGLEIH